MGRNHNPDQEWFPWEAEKNELLAQIRLLRRIDLGISAGRAEGVIQLLERLILLGNDLREIHGLVMVKAQVIAIAARVDRSTVSDKTVRNWCRDAKELGILSVDVRSHKYGRKEWNVYRIDVGAIRTLISAARSADTQPAHTGPQSDTQTDSRHQAATRPGKRSDTQDAHPGHDTHPFAADTRRHADTRRDGGTRCKDGLVDQSKIEGGNGRKWAETVTAPRPEMVTAPRAETVTAPSHCLETKPTHTPNCESPGTAARGPRPEVSKGRVVRVFLELGVFKAGELVTAAMARGCDTRSLMALARYFQRSQLRYPRRWHQPQSVLMIRLRDAQPEIPFWLGWVTGNRPVATAKPQCLMSQQEKQAVKLANRRAWQQSISPVEELKQMQLQKLQGVK